MFKLLIPSTCSTEGAGGRGEGALALPVWQTAPDIAPRPVWVSRFLARASLPVPWRVWCGREVGNAGCCGLVGRDGLVAAAICVGGQGERLRTGMYLQEGL